MGKRSHRQVSLGACRILVSVFVVSVFVVAASLAASAGIAGGDTSGSARAAPLRLGKTGYVVPGRLRPAPAGGLIAARRLTGRNRMFGGARAWQVTYHSRDLSGHDIAVSGLVLLPSGHAPAGGWPVVGWAHGTTGLADRCAPSLAADLGHDRSAVREVRNLLAHHLAVVATDYPGLGTPGVHPYLVGQANAHGTVDAVTAAHQLLPGALSRAWVAVGHSEGGQTALLTAQEAQTRAPQWDYLGTVALAPASTLEGLVPLTAATHDPVDQAYLMYAVVGLATVDPSVKPARLFTAAARSRLGLLAHACIDDITASLTRHPVDQVLDAEPAVATALSAELARYADPDHLPGSGPFLVLQGTDDHDVPAGATTALVGRLCALGDAVEYRQYAGQDHEGVVTTSQPDVAAWIAARFAGASAQNTCGMGAISS